LEEAKKSLSRLYRAVEGFEVNGKPDEELIINLCDDINTPKALARAHYLTDEANKGSKECAQKLKNSSKLLGILSQSTEEWFKFRKELNQGQSFEIYMTEKEIEELILERKTAKDSKDYSKADQIREKLLKLDIVLEDRADKTIWRKN
jgi:cysteinyl-tRNA synthetase